MDFIALDFETANQKTAPCSIGIVVMENGSISKEYHSLINPEQPFSSVCISVHGITKDDVANAPIFPDVWKEVECYFKRFPVVAHNAHFEKSVLEKVLQRYGLPTHKIAYYDTMEIYGKNYNKANKLSLKNMCAELGVPLSEHHHALADAKAAAQAMQVMLLNQENVIFPSAIGNEIKKGIPASKGNNKSIAKYYNNEPEYVATTATIDRVDNIVFEGSTFVLTGLVQGYDRDALKEAITNLGGKVTGAVSKKTTYLVAGLQDITVISDNINAKSSKIIKAEQLREQGADIRIINSETLKNALSKANT